MAENRQPKKGDPGKSNVVTRKKNRRSLQMVIIYAAVFLIAMFDKFYGDTAIVMWFQYLDEDGDSWFNPDYIEASLQTILVGGIAVLTYMGINLAKNEEA